MGKKGGDEVRAKIAFFNKHLDLSVVVHMNPRVEGVIVPLHLKQRAMIYLQFGHGFPTPIRNLEVDDDGIRATLSFDQKPFDCVIPWESVYGLQCGETVQAWPENFPPELRPQQTQGTKQPKRIGPKPKRPQLRLIQGGKQ
jgi:hypothetical protein